MNPSPRLRQRSSPASKPCRRRGSVYVAVLGVATIITTLGVGGILASRVQFRSSDDGRDIADARYAAYSGLETARQWIAANPAWRSGAIFTSGSIVVGGCTVSIGGSNVSDANLSTIPLDPIYLTATAQKGNGVNQALRQTVVAVGTPQDFLNYGLHVAGPLHILAGNRLICNQTVSSNDEFKTEGTLEGSVVAKKITNSGIVYGNGGTITTARTLPAASNAETFAAIGTLIAPGDVMSGVALGPGRNPYGAANANGVYVIRADKKFTLQNCRVVGTLVIIAKKDVAIAGSVSMQPARSDFPALIITGDTTFSFTTATLSEATLGVNLNPVGVSVNSVSNNTLTDSFASEIDGLVDIGGQLTLAGTGLVRGAIVCSETGGDAVKVTANPFQIVYDPTLFSSPPNYYTSAVTMVSQAGSIVPIVK